MSVCFFVCPYPLEGNLSQCFLFSFSAPASANSLGTITVSFHFFWWFGLFADNGGLQPFEKVAKSSFVTPELPFN